MGFNSTKGSSTPMRSKLTLFERLSPGGATRTWTSAIWRLKTLRRTLGTVCSSFSWSSYVCNYVLLKSNALQEITDAKYKFPRYNKKPRMRMQYMENIGKVHCKAIEIFLIFLDRVRTHACSFCKCCSFCLVGPYFHPRTRLIPR